MLHGGAALGAPMFAGRVRPTQPTGSHVTCVGQALARGQPQALAALLAANAAPRPIPGHDHDPDHGASAVTHDMTVSDPLVEACGKWCACLTGRLLPVHVHSTR